MTLYSSRYISLKACTSRKKYRQALWRSRSWLRANSADSPWPRVFGCGESPEWCDCPQHSQIWLKNDISRPTPSQSRFQSPRPVSAYPPPLLTHTPPNTSSPSLCPLIFSCCRLCDRRHETYPITFGEIALFKIALAVKIDMTKTNCKRKWIESASGNWPTELAFYSWIVDMHAVKYVEYGKRVDNQHDR